MKLDDIRIIIEMMDKHGLTEFKIDEGETHLCLKRDLFDKNAVMAAPVAAPTATTTFVPAAAANTQPAAPAEAPKETIDAPIVGTFYRSPSPDAEMYVNVGDKVTPDTIVGIVEAMKVMNEIKAEKTGVIKEIVADNGQSVEYGSPLFVVE